MKHEIEAYEGELQELRAKVARFQLIVQHATPEKTGAFFICGHGGTKDATGLPASVMICPSPGSDGFAVYKKVSEYSAPGY